MIEPWPVRRSARIYENKIFGLREDWCADPRDGKEHPFWIIESVDWVNAVARTEAGDYILVAQWRFGVRDVGLEIPGGMIDPGESPAEAIARELLEETGYVARSLVEIGTVDPNPAILSNKLWLFAAEGCRLAPESERRRHDATEQIEVRLLSEGEVDEFVAAGMIRHTNVLSALLRYRLDTEYESGRKRIM